MSFSKDIDQRSSGPIRALDAIWHQQFSFFEEFNILTTCLNANLVITSASIEINFVTTYLNDPIGAVNKLLFLVLLQIIHLKQTTLHYLHHRSRSLTIFWHFTR